MCATSSHILNCYPYLARLRFRRAQYRFFGVGVTSCQARFSEVDWLGVGQESSIDNIAYTEKRYLSLECALFGFHREMMYSRVYAQRVIVLGGCVVEQM